MRNPRPEIALFGWVLRAYPADFRSRFGNEMMDVFSEDIRDRHKQRGFLGSVNGVCSALWEVISVAGPLRFKGSLAPAVVISIVASSIFTLAFFAAVAPRCIK